MDKRTLGERLRHAVTEGGLSVRAFHRAMDGERGVYGSSYPNVHRYLADKADPSLEFLRQASDLLSVRYEWLAVGHGQPTEAEQAAAEAGEALELENEIRAVLSEEDGNSKELLMRKQWTGALSQILESTLGTRVPLVAQVVIAHHWRRLQQKATGSLDSDAPEDMLRRLARSVAAPLNEFGVSPSDLRDEELTHYLMGVVPPVSTAMEFCLSNPRDQQLVTRWQRVELEGLEGEELEDRLHELDALARRMAERGEAKRPMPGE